MAVALAVALATAATSGCSFAISAPDPNRPRHELPKCDTGRAPMAPDILLGLFTGSLALVAVSSDVPSISLVPGSLSALSFLAAARGNRAASECEKAQDEYRDYVRTLSGGGRRAPRAAAARPGANAAPATPVFVSPAPTAKPAPAPVAKPAPAPTAKPAAPVAKPAPPVANPAPASPAPTTNPAAAPSKPTPSPAGEGPWDEFWKETR